MAFTDDFNRADSPTVGNGWVEESAAAFEILGGKLRGYSGVNFPDSQLLRPAGEAFADGTVQIDFQFVTSTNGVPQLHGRCQGASDNTFYLIYVAGATLYLAYNAGGFGNIATAPTGALSAGINYRLKLVMNGTSVSGELVNLDTTTTLATVSAIDATVTGSGRQALSTGISGNPIDYDNFYASTLSTGVAVADVGGGVDSAVVTPFGLKTVADTGGGVDSAVLPYKELSVTDAGGAAESISGPPLGDQLVWVERFDGTLGAWTLDETGGTVTIQTVSNDEKMVLADASAVAVVSATRGFTQPNAAYIVEADMAALGSAVGWLEILDSSDNVLFSVKVDAAASQSTFGTNADAPSTFPGASARQVVIVVDPGAGTARCFYTTGSGTAPSKWNAVSAAKAYTDTGAAKIRLITDTASTGDLHVDEVKIYRPEIFCLGDSNTAGHAPTGPCWNPVPSASERIDALEDETHSFPYRLGQKYAPVQWVANRGINADKSVDADGRVLDSVIDQGAGTCVVFIGTNDILGGIPVASTQANISSIIGKLNTAGVDVILCSIPPSNGWSPGQNADRDAMNAWLQGQAVAGGYGFADIYTAVRDTADPDIILAAYDAGDGLHFSAAGLQAIADTIFNAPIPNIIVDSGAGIDALAAVVATIVAETASGADGASIQIMALVSDAGQGIDSASVAGSSVVADGSAGTDAVAIFVGLALTDTGSGVDTASLVLDIPVSDAGAGADAVVLAVFDSFPMIAEACAGLDAITVSVSGGATSQDIYDLLQAVRGDVMTRLASVDYIPPDNSGVAFIRRWILNRLTVTNNNDGTESITLYDDDDTTVLKTWSWHKGSKTRGRAT